MNKRRAGGGVKAPTGGFVIADRREAQQIVLEVWETLKSDPDAKMPPSLAALLDAEMQGMTWNFITGKFEREDE